MTYQFPHDAAFLPRTKLSYVNLPGILSDGKRDRDHVHRALQVADQQHRDQAEQREDQRGGGPLLERGGGRRGLRSRRGRKER